ncbi:MAG: mechanosensitive ion channel family protein [Agarilytica sp.]
MTKLSELIEILEATRLLSVSQAILFIVLGYFLGRAASATIEKIALKKMSPHNLLVLKRSVFYAVFILFGVSALKQLGLDLNVVIGAAGILTVAIGFASQTSASNLISGLFLMVERPFSVADVIRVGSTTGEVISIDLLSIKLRTFDNLFVRIPNETMIKSEVTTLTKFPIRRIDMQIAIAYKEDLDNVKAILDTLAANNPLCLEEPAPVFIFQAFGSSSIDLQYSIWAKRENFLKLKNSMYEGVKKAFEENNIEIPFPHVSLYAGEASKAVAINLIDGEELK